MRKTKIIAEIGINHNGSEVIAKELIKASYFSGCDAIKFQYRNLLRSYASKNCKEIGDGLLQSEINRCYLTPDQILNLTNYAKDKYKLEVGISFFTDEDINDFNKSINKFDFFKVPSVEFSNSKLISKLSELEKPILLSLGCNTEATIINQIKSFDINKTVLLHCVSNYPVEIFNAKLGYIKHLKKIWEGQIGYSSHDSDWRVCISAMTLGIDWLERHITLDKKDFGLDHTTSSTPEEFKDLCFFARELGLALSGNVPRELNAGELINLQNLGRSPYLLHSFNEGKIISENDIVWRSPQVGLDKNEFKGLIKVPIKKSIEVGEPLCKHHYENNDNEYQYEHSWLNDKKISLPSRIHDSDIIYKQTSIVYQELHLSFKEVLSEDLLNPKNYSNLLKYSIHLPDYIDSNTIIDPFSQDSEIRNLSIKIVRNCLNLSLYLYDLTGEVIPIVGSFSKRHSSKELDIKRINEFCSENSKNGVNFLMPQWLPPIAWYFGGSVKLNLFNSIEDLEIMNKFGCNFCLDICHAFMCFYIDENILDEISKSFSLVKHIHIAGATSIDGEGESLNKMNETQLRFLRKVIDLPYIKVLEVWQGHLNNYKGFKKSLIEIPKLAMP